MSSEIQLYLPTTLTTKVSLRARDLNPSLHQNIQQAVERKFGNKFFSFGHIRPGTIQIVRKSMGNKINTSDFKGNMYYRVKFQCEIYLPQIGQEIQGRVKSINKIGILAKSDNNKLTILLSKPHQSNLELFSQAMPETRIVAKIVDYKIDNQNDTIVVFGDLNRIVEGIYQNYQLPVIDGVRIEIRGDLQPTSEIHSIYVNYGDFIESVNSKSLMDPYSMFKPAGMPPRDWTALRSKKNWLSFKDYWTTAKSMVEDYELVHPTKGYNRGNGVAITPFKSKPITRAYFKLWELLHRYPDIIRRIESEANLNILALAEGPGGFIQSLSHYRAGKGAIQDNYYGYTLKTDFNPSLCWDWPFSKEQLGQIVCQKMSLKYGDLTKAETIKGILKDLGGTKVDLVVADGAIENINVYNYEEVVNYRLFFGEIVAAMLNQKIGGNFVIKIFDILTHVTRQFLLLLDHYYSEVFITKPDFSRPASSEKYVVCLGFKGLITPDQTEETVQETLLELMETWNKKIVEKLDIYYPNNETFLLRLLNYNLSEEGDFAKKINEISQDHIQKQTEHIAKGIHLIHTKILINERQIEQIKNSQMRKAVQWCQRYKLQYNEDISFVKESVIESEIVNTNRTMAFSLKTVEKDEKETYQYLKNQYPFLTLEYLQERVIALQFRLEPILGEYLSNEIYRFKSEFLNPTGYLNDELGEKFTQGWYATYEILSAFKIAQGRTKYSFLVNADHFGADATRGVFDYLSKRIKIAEKNLDWSASLDYQKYLVKGQLPDPTGFIGENRKNWLMGAEEGQTSGDLTKLTTLEWFEKRFADAKNRVDLYFGDLRIPTGDSLSQGFLIDPERMTVKEMLGQILVGLMALNDKGEMICRQYTFFEDLTVGVLLVLQDLFENIDIVKPLLSLAESTEVYLVCRNFQKKKFTEKIKGGFLDLYQDIPERGELEEPETPLPELDTKLTDPKKIEGLKEKLIYLGYRIYILNHVPKIQINLDLFENPRYQISSQQQSAMHHLLIDKQELVEKDDELTGEDQSQLAKIDQQIDQIFSEVAKRVIGEDFKYLIEETVTNWLDLYAPKK